MKSSLIILADRFASKLGIEKRAGKGKSMSRAHIQKAIEKARNTHGNLKKIHDTLETNDAKLKSQLDDCRSELAKTRKHIMAMHEASNHMDLASANDAVFYDDDEDIGYLIDGKEYHLDLAANGEITLTPMNKHRKELKESKKKKDEEEFKDDETDEKVDDSNELDTNIDSQGVNPDKHTENFLPAESEEVPEDLFKFLDE